MKTPKTTSRPWTFIAILLAWLIPGAGHFYIGRRIRGGIIFVTITATFWAGVGMGGVLTVDQHHERWWFAADMLAGANGLIGWYRQDQIYKELAADPKIGPPPSIRSIHYLDWLTRVDERLAEKGIALVPPADTPARIYTGIAGLLNLLCIFDVALLALMGIYAEPRMDDDKKQEEKKI